MASDTAGEVAYEHSNYFRIYKDGRINRIAENEVVPPSIDPVTGVESKDVVVDPTTGVSARLYRPRFDDPSRKLPLLFYFHGGGFIMQTAASRLYHNYLNSLAAEAGVIAVSVNYRRAPEHPLPDAYDDCWTVLKWVGSQADGSGPHQWLNDCPDFDHVFFAGDSAGANLAHHMALRVGLEGLGRVKLVGVALVHPYFWGKDLIGSELEKPEMKTITEILWRLACPSSSGLDDPWINPLKDPNLSKLGCSKVLVCVAGRDGLKERGRIYRDELSRSGWQGEVELMQTEDEEHVFHLLQPGTSNALAMLKKLASFLIQDKP